MRNSRQINIRGFTKHYNLHRGIKPKFDILDWENALLLLEHNPIRTLKQYCTAKKSSQVHKYKSLLYKYLSLYFLNYVMAMVFTPLSTIFQSYIVAACFSGGGNRSTRRKPVASHWQTLYNIMFYRVHLAWAGFELTTLVVPDTDCICSFKSMTMMAHTMKL